MPDLIYSADLVAIYGVPMKALNQAVKALERAIEIDLRNAHALRNLAAIHGKESPSRALPFMQEAARLLPGDQRSQFGLAQCLLQLGRVEDADPLLVKTISLDPLNEIAELARAERSRIAQANLRTNAGGGARPDTVFFCLDALQKFQALGEEQTKTITFEIAILGRQGLDINDPSKKYTHREPARPIFRPPPGPAPVYGNAKDRPKHRRRNRSVLRTRRGENSTRGSNQPAEKLNESKIHHLQKIRRAMVLQRRGIRVERPASRDERRGRAAVERPASRVEPEFNIQNAPSLPAPSHPLPVTRYPLPVTRLSSIAANPKSIIQQFIKI